MTTNNNNTDDNDDDDDKSRSSLPSTNSSNDKAPDSQGSTVVVKKATSSSSTKFFPKSSKQETQTVQTGNNNSDVVNDYDDDDDKDCERPVSLREEESLKVLNDIVEMRLHQVQTTKSSSPDLKQQQQEEAIGESALALRSRFEHAQARIRLEGSTGGSSRRMVALSRTLPQDLEGTEPEALDSRNTSVFMGNQQDDSNNVDTAPVHAHAVETDVEIAQIRQDLIQQAPQATVVMSGEDNDDDGNGNTRNKTANDDDDSNRNNIWFRVFALLFIGLIAILLAVILSSANNQKDSQTAVENGPTTTVTPGGGGNGQGPPPAADVDRFQSECPFFSDSSIQAMLEAPNSDIDSYYCGPLHTMYHLLPNQLGIGTCRGQECQIFDIYDPQEEYFVGCYLARLVNGTLVPTTSARLDPTTNQAGTCKSHQDRLCGAPSGVTIGGGGGPPSGSGNGPPSP